jgi:hypothetical protein
VYHNHPYKVVPNREFRAPYDFDDLYVALPEYVSAEWALKKNSGYGDVPTELGWSYKDIVFEQIPSDVLMDVLQNNSRRPKVFGVARTHFTNFPAQGYRPAPRGWNMLLG